MQATDYWGNTAAPTADLSVNLQVECAVLQPSPACFPFAADGTATVSDLAICRPSEPAECVQHDMTMILQCSCSSPHVQSAVQLAQQAAPPPLVCQLALEPSTSPSMMCLTYVGEDLPYGEVSIAEGVEGEPTHAFLLNGATAGSRVKQLSYRMVDEVGRPAAAGVRGKLQVPTIFPCYNIALLL